MKAPAPNVRMRWSQRQVRLFPLVPFFLAALLLHVVALLTLRPLAPMFAPAKVEAPKPEYKPIELVTLPPEEKQPDEPKPEEEEEKEPEKLDGQIVEIAPPEDQTAPKDAQYLAQYNSTVKEETRAEKFKMNPDVLAPTYSDESKVQKKSDDVVDLHMDKPSTGATVGNDRFDPNRDGALAALPSKWTMTNREGNADPVPSSALESALQGAPSNDLLDEKRGTSTNLNTKEFMYSSYILRIRRLVNFYWNQNLQNLPASVALVKPQYTTNMNVVLDGNGALEVAEVTGKSGSAELDDCVVRAFKLAGPFPNPPEGLISKDGRVYLPDMGFSVVLEQASNQYKGIDPRSGVEFPGIVKSAPH